MSSDMGESADPASASNPPASRHDFGVAIICALPKEADAVLALFDRHWDDEERRYGKEPGDRNAYSTGAIGRHNIVLVHMEGMGKAAAAAAAADCRSSFPNVKLALLVGICGAVPRTEGKDHIFLGDVVVSEGIVQYDFGRRLPESFQRKTTVLDSLGRPDAEIRGLLAKLSGVAHRRRFTEKMTKYLGDLQKHSDLDALYPGASQDVVFKPKYRHVQDGKTCDECRCSRTQVLRRRRTTDMPQPSVHFGLFASGDTVMKSGEERDSIAKDEKVIAFEMEGAGAWGAFPCAVVIKGACDYADSHKTKGWQRYAAATAAACAKAFLDNWEGSVPLASGLASLPLLTPTLTGPANTDVTPQSIVSSADSGNGRRFHLPFEKNKKFVERAGTLTSLTRTLFELEDSRRFAVFGLGGVGKTQLALQLAYWVDEHKPEWSVFWLPAWSMPGFVQACAEIATDLGIEGSDQEDSKERFRRYLESGQSGNWLLIIDNADDMEVVSQLKGFHRQFPKSPRGRVLFTTRFADVANEVADENVLELGEMTEEEAQEFLRKLLPKISEDSQSAATLLSELTYLPLAISQAAAYIKRNRITIQKYLALLHKTQQEVIGLFSREFHDPHRYESTRNAVTQTWLVSFEQIRRDDPYAADLLSFISQIEPRSIPQSMLPLPDTKTEEELFHAVGTLQGYAFLHKRGDAETFDMHRLVHLATQAWIEAGETAEQVRSNAIAHLQTVFQTDDWEHRETWRQYMPHVLRILSTDNEVPDWSEDQCELAYWAGRCLDVEGRFPQSVDLLQRLVATQMRTLAEDHTDRLSSQHALAGAYENNGLAQEAVDLLEHVVDIKSRIFAHDHPSRLASQHRLARAYRTNGQIQEAVNLLEYIVEMESKILAEDDRDRLASEHELAKAYQAKGQIQKAVNLLERVVDIESRRLAEDHPDRLVSQHELAGAYHANGQVQEAIALLEQVVDIKSRILAEDHPDRLASQHQLGRAYQANGQIQEAITLLEHVVELRTRLPENHPDRLASQLGLASAFQANGQIQETVTLLKHVVELQTRLSENHPSRLASQHALARAYQATGHVQEAVNLFEHVVGIKKRLAEDYPSRLTSQHALAGAYEANGQTQEAIALLKHVVEIQATSLRPDHPSRKIAEEELARMLSSASLE